MLDDIAEYRHVLLAIFCDTVFLSRTPPFHSLQSVAAFCCAKRVFGKLVKLYAMPKRFEEYFVNVERPFLKFVNGGIRAQNLQVKPVSVEGDDVREFLKFCD